MRILLIDIIHPLLKKELELQGYVCDEAYHMKKDKVLSRINDYEGIVLRSRLNIDKVFLKKCSTLKFIARAGSGLENIDLNFAKEKGIKCLSAPEGNRQAVAEHSIGMLLSLFNNLTISNNQVKNKEWLRESNRGIELAGKTIGIIGFGNNGSALAKVLEGFKVKILAYDKYKHDYLFQTSMEEIYEHADIVSLNIPLTDETLYLANKNFFDHFKKPIYLINTSRGKCINTRDLVKAMQEKKVLGVCLDVLEYESDSFENLKEDTNQEIKYLLKSHNTMLSPHIAGWTKESNLRIAKILIKKINSL